MFYIKEWLLMITGVYLGIMSVTSFPPHADNNVMVAKAASAPVFTNGRKCKVLNQKGSAHGMYVPGMR